MLSRQWHMQSNHSKNTSLSWGILMVAIDGTEDYMQKTCATHGMHAYDIQTRVATNL